MRILELVAIFIVTLPGATSLVAQAGSQSLEWHDSTGQLRTRAAFDSILAQHRLWLSSEGKKGRRAVFRFASFSKQDLSHADLTQVDFSGAKLRGTDLSEAVLRRAAFAQADLSDARLTRADLSYAGLSLANLSNADLQNAQFRNANLGGVRLAGAHLEGADLSTTLDLSTLYTSDAVYFDATTKWPEGFAPPSNLRSMHTRLQQKLLGMLDKAFSEWGTLLFVALIVALIVGGVVSARAEAKKLREQENKVKGLEQAEPQAMSAIDFTRSELAVAIERERVSMLLAQSRSNRLFTLATWFVVLSLSAPLLSMYLYAQSDPLDIVSRANASGLKLDLQKDAFQRDWHLLVSGVSYAFVFLAAAAGVLRQARHHTATFFRLGNRVTHYEAMISALKVAQRLSPTDFDNIGGKLLRRVVDKLIDSESEQVRHDEDVLGAEEATPSVAEAIVDLAQARKVEH